MSRQEAYNHYMQALKAGKKYRRKHPDLRVLDEIVDQSQIVSQEDMGIVEIPMERIVGTKTRGRVAAFAGNFMPLLPTATEFGYKWMGVYEAQISENTELYPISCFEYLGNFYVQEGNKRVSVLKSMGAPTIPGHVIRLVPAWSREPAVQVYYEFLRAYELSGLYQVFFTQSCSFWKLQEALGFAYSHVWTQEDRRRFLAGLLFFREAYEKVGGARFRLTATDALLIWLRLHRFEELKKWTMGRRSALAAVEMSAQR